MHRAGHDGIHKRSPGEPGILVTAPVIHRIEFPVDIGNAELFSSGLYVFHGSNGNLTDLGNFEKTHLLNSPLDPTLTSGQSAASGRSCHRRVSLQLSPDSSNGRPCRTLP